MVGVPAADLLKRQRPHLQKARHAAVGQHHRLAPGLGGQRGERSLLCGAESGGMTFQRVKGGKARLVAARDAGEAQRGHVQIRDGPGLAHSLVEGPGKGQVPIGQGLQRRPLPGADGQELAAQLVFAAFRRPDYLAGGAGAGEQQQSRAPQHFLIGGEVDQQIPGGQCVGGDAGVLGKLDGGGLCQTEAGAAAQGAQGLDTGERGHGFGALGVQGL